MQNNPAEVNYGLILVPIILASINVLATIVYVVLTGKLVKETREANQTSKNAVQASVNANLISNQAVKASESSILLSQKQLDLSSEVEQNRIRPWVFFNININYDEERIVFSSLKNFGITPAFKVKVNLEPKLFVVGIQEEYEDAISENVVNFLPANYEITNQIGNSVDFRNRYDNSPFVVSIDYEDANENKYSDEYDLNILNLTRINTRTETITRTLNDMLDGV